MRPDAGAKHLARQLDDTRYSLRGEPSDPSAMNLEPVALKRVALMHTDRQKIQAIGPHICSSEQSLAFGSEQTEQLEGQVPSNVTKLWSSYCLESQTLLKGQDISDAKVRKKRTRRRTIYGLEFKLGEETAKDFAKWIEDQRRGKLALVVDNEVLWTAELPESYFGTRLRVTMNPRQPASTQRRLAKRIQTLARSGRLPLSVDKVLINLNRR
jgi:preprotein translocase subunit SecD